jgi:hypothetical protein
MADSEGALSRCEAAARRCEATQRLERRQEKAVKALLAFEK